MKNKLKVIVTKPPTKEEAKKKIEKINDYLKNKYN